MSATMTAITDDQLRQRAEQERLGDDLHAKVNETMQALSASGWCLQELRLYVEDDGSVTALPLLRKHRRRRRT